MTRTATAAGPTVVLDRRRGPQSRSGVGALTGTPARFTVCRRSITAPALGRRVDTPWWRWAVAGAGLLCVAVALRWLVAHRPTRKAAPILTARTRRPRHRHFDPAAVATAAAEPCNATRRCVRAKGKAIADRGTRTIELAVTAAHPEQSHPDHGHR